VSLGESTVNGEFTADRGEDGVSSMPGYDVPTIYDWNNPNVIMDRSVIAALMSRRSVADPRSPTVQLNEQVTVTEHLPNGAVFTFDADPSTSTENVGGIDTSSPTQCDAPLSQPKGDANAGGNPNSNDSNGNDGNQGGTSDGNDPQGPVPDRSYLVKLVFSYCAGGGPSSNWGIEGRIRVADVVQLVGPEANLSIQSIQRLLQPDLVNQVATDAHFACQHNDRR